ncbi:MAG: pyridoxal phosphate-dependent decarboxylase family protein [Vulcanimicrobiaceae bacterium]
MNEPESFREAFARAGEWIAEYYRDTEHFPVLSRAAPGALVRALPPGAPEQPVSYAEILEDFERLIVPAVTHWNHPRFFAYFAISATPASVIAEALAAALDQNAMLWRTSPAATELEEVVVGWLRELMGLDSGWHGWIYDTASIGGFTALAAAREAVGIEVRERGLAGRRDLAALRVYLTAHTHSHIEKAAIALGIGRENVVRVAVDERYAMRPEALANAIAQDRALGLTPMCAVATVGTTSTTAFDPLEPIGEITSHEQVWLHVDAAYAGAAALLPEHRALLAGAERADSLVVNPHKWLFVPVDCSVLYVRDPELLRRTFSLVPDYLAHDDDGVRNGMDYGLQLGRRFRALKLWFALRRLGAAQIRALIAGHIALAQRFAQWVRAEPDWEVVAPHPLSVVCFRSAPPGFDADAVDGLNARIVDAANSGGEIFLSSTRLDERLVLRLAIGNERTTEADVATAWRVLRECAAAARAEPQYTRKYASRSQG